MTPTDRSRQRTTIIARDKAPRPDPLPCSPARTTPDPFPRDRRLGSLAFMSDQAAQHQEGPHGVGLLPRDLTEDELRAAPILVSADTLLIDDLTVDEDESFAAALDR